MPLYIMARVFPVAPTGLVSPDFTSSAALDSHRRNSTNPPGSVRHPSSDTSRRSGQVAVALRHRVIRRTLPPPLVLHPSTIAKRFLAQSPRALSLAIPDPPLLAERFNVLRLTIPARPLTSYAPFASIRLCRVQISPCSTPESPN